MNWLKSLSLICIVVVLGCAPSDQPPLGRVYGTVTLDGEPLAGVIVNFQPESGRASTAETDAKGYYDLVYVYGTNGAKVGNNSVSFRWPDGSEGKKALPKKYTGATKEIIEVKSGKNKLDWALTSK